MITMSKDSKIMPNGSINWTNESWIHALNYPIQSQLEKYQDQTHTKQAVTWIPNLYNVNGTPQTPQYWLPSPPIIQGQQFLFLNHELQREPDKEPIALHSKRPHAHAFLPLSPVSLLRPNTIYPISPASILGATTQTFSQKPKCKAQKCRRNPVKGATLCYNHGGRMKCEHPGCHRNARGCYRLCRAHGGGPRCKIANCTKSAIDSSRLCRGHGGGPRCQHEGCHKSAVGSPSIFCIAHGGGKRCEIVGCTKSAQRATSRCIAHGGGKRCQKWGCPKSAQGISNFCKGHGGGVKINRRVTVNDMQEVSPIQSDPVGNHSLSSKNKKRPRSEFEIQINY